MSLLLSATSRSEPLSPERPLVQHGQPVCPNTERPRMLPRKGAPSPPRQAVEPRGPHRGARGAQSKDAGWAPFPPGAGASWVSGVTGHVLLKIKMWSVHPTPAKGPRTSSPPKWAPPTRLFTCHALSTAVCQALFKARGVQPRARQPLPSQGQHASGGRPSASRLLTCRKRQAGRYGERGWGQPRSPGRQRALWGKLATAESCRVSPRGQHGTQGSATRARGPGPFGVQHTARHCLPNAGCTPELGVLVPIWWVTPALEWAGGRPRNLVQTHMWTRTGTPQSQWRLRPRP